MRLLVCSPSRSFLPPVFQTRQQKVILGKRQFSLHALMVHAANTLTKGCSSVRLFRLLPGTREGVNVPPYCPSFPGMTTITVLPQQFLSVQGRRRAIGKSLY